MASSNAGGSGLPLASVRASRPTSRAVNAWPISTGCGVTALLVTIVVLTCCCTLHATPVATSAPTDASATTPRTPARTKVAIFIGFSRKRGGSPRSQRPGNITLRLDAVVRSVERSAVSSDITVDEARAVVAGWVRAQAAADPAFRGAFLTGSATDLPGGAPLPRSSDVDLTVLVAASSTAAVDRPISGVATGPTAAAASGRRSGKQLVGGVLVDVSYLEERALADPAWVATSFVYAPSFRGGQVLADPAGHLARLEAAIAPSFAAPAAVRARTADVHRRIRARLTALDPDAPWAELVLQWLFPTSLTAVARLVAALRMPTVRQRYLRARAVTPPAEYERLLALLGCADATRSLVAQHLDAVAERFDEAAAALAATGPAGPACAAAHSHPPSSAEATQRRQSRRTGQPRPRRPGWSIVARWRRPPPQRRTRLQAASHGRGRVPASAPPERGRADRPSAPAGGGPRLPFAADLTPAARPVAIDGSRELVDGGNHREAVFWVVATAARCQAALNVLAPALAAEREQAFRALVADLTGLRSPTDVLTRRDALLADLAAAQMAVRRALRCAPTGPAAHRMSHPPRASLRADLAPPPTG